MTGNIAASSPDEWMNRRRAEVGKRATACTSAIMLESTEPRDYCKPSTSFPEDRRHWAVTLTGRVANLQILSVLCETFETSHAGRRTVDRCCHYSTHASSVGSCALRVASHGQLNTTKYACA